jgi:transcriptional regulator with XRE-family HTH domain
MRLIKNYVAPSTVDLNQLKNDLGMTGNQMADLVGVSSNSQWRKYTGGENPRPMSPQMLFYLAAQLSLTDDELLKVVKKMQEIGAEIE